MNRGRARDPSINTRVLKAAARHLAAYGYEAMSVAAVAEEAGTTRQALYRRWPGKAELSAAALAGFADQATGADSADPFADLVAELADFQRGVSRPGRLSLVVRDLPLDDPVLRNGVSGQKNGTLIDFIDSAPHSGAAAAPATLAFTFTRWFSRAKRSANSCFPTVFK